MTPTAEQLTIIEAVRSTEDSLLITALAGAAKTTTLELIAKALPSTPILSLAFNKRIADEMSKRLPPNVVARTMNSVGHRVWSASIGRRLIVDTSKTYTLIKDKVDTFRGQEKKEAYEIFTEVKKMVSSAKLNGYMPHTGLTENARRLIEADDFFDSFEEEPTGLHIDLLNSVLITSIKMGYDGKIDFDDQVYLPTLFGGVDWPKFPLVLVDEAQDLSPLNHAMLDKLVTKRIIAVGDEHQSIYAFRGADTYSMRKLESKFSMSRLPLTISFRCPREVVRLARRHAPDMQWPDWAEEGEVRSLAEWSAEDIPDNSAVICRNNAPLFRLAFLLLANGRGVKLVGTDLGPGLVKILKKLGPESMSKEATNAAIDRWQEARLKKSRAVAAIEDKANCLRVFASFGETLGGAIAYAEHLFATDGPIQLLSGHKAKGLEWDVVFHLDPWRVPSKWAVTEEDLQQEANVEYVITTRAKRQLNFINLEDFMDNEEAEAKKTTRLSEQEGQPQLDHLPPSRGADAVPVPDGG